MTDTSNVVQEGVSASEQIGQHITRIRADMKTLGRVAHAAAVLVTAAVCEPGGKATTAVVPLEVLDELAAALFALDERRANR